MTTQPHLSASQIHQAVEAIRTIRPAYTDLLAYYEQVFVAQEQIMGQITMDPLPLDAETVTLKLREQLPLVEKDQFRIHAPLSQSLFKTLCRISHDGGPEPLKNAAEILINSLENAKINPSVLFFSFLSEDENSIEDQACKIGVDPRFIRFFLYNSLTPSLAAFSREMAASYLKPDHHWEKGYCPVCGSLPVLSVLGPEGARFLVCGFCWHQWPMKRITCPFCENRTSNTLFYFFSEAEKEYRVDCCDQCKKYIKTVDNRQIERIFHPPLEYVVTLHLDLMAKEQGYQPGSRIMIHF